MTILEFFYNQTTKQIKDCFRKVGLEKYINVPENADGFCKMFGLEPDARLHLFTIVRGGQCELYVYFSVPNEVFPTTPIKFGVEYSINSCKGACSISIQDVFDESNECCYFSEVTDLYDSRDEYNNIECRVNKSDLHDVFEPKGGWGEREYLSKQSTIKDVYDAVMKYAASVKPYVDAFMLSTKDGSYEKIWNKYLPNEPWKRGHEIFKQYGALHVKSWMLLEQSGHKTSLEDFILLLVATDKLALGDRTGSVYDKRDDVRINACLEAIESYKKNFIDDTSFNDWCELFERANREFYKRFTVLHEEVSREFGINKKYLNNTTGRALAHMKFLGHEIPKDAYILDEQNDSEE